jgi:hypothetical protein
MLEVHMRTIIFRVFLLQMSLSACSGAIADVGSDSGTDAGNWDSPAGDAGDAMLDSASEQVPPSPIDGVWKGYIESFTFPSGSDAVVLSLKASGGAVVGTAVFGNAPTPTPATDPNGPYPANYHMTTPFHGEGFAFTLLGGTFDGTRFRGGVMTLELFASWCSIQTKTYEFAPDSGVYSCLPNWGYSSNFNTCTSTNPGNPSDKLVYDCEKLDLCNGGACACTMKGCAPLMLVAPGDITFDLMLQSSSMDGSTVAFGGKNVHLKKQ